MIERAFATLGDAGHARMLAWRVLLAERPESPDRTLLRSLGAVVALATDPRAVYLFDRSTGVTLAQADLSRTHSQELAASRRAA